MTISPIAIPTAFAAIALLVIAWTTWGRPWLTRARASSTSPGRITAATVRINPRAIAHADPHPTSVTLHIEYGQDQRFSSTTSSRLLPMRVAKRVVGVAHVFHSPRLPVADRASALAQARAGGVSFPLDPPIDVRVFRTDDGDVTWS